MSETMPPPESPAPAPKPSKPQHPAWALIEPQTVIALLVLGLAYVIVVATIKNGNESLQSQVLLLASSAVTGIMGFYFGAAVQKVASDSTKPPTTP